MDRKQVVEDYGAPPSPASKAPAAFNNLGRCTSGFSLPLGSLGGVPLKLHVSFLILYALDVLYAWPLSRKLYLTYQADWEEELGEAPAVKEVPFHFIWVVLVILLFGPVRLLTVWVHMYAMAWSVKRSGGIIGEIVLWPLGGFMSYVNAGGTLCADIKMSIIGPLTHIPMGLIWLMLLYLTFKVVSFETEDELSDCWNDISVEQKWQKCVVHHFLSNFGPGATFFSLLSTIGIIMNMNLLVLNLFIPAYPLGGGRVLAAISALKLEAAKAAKVTSKVGMVASVGMIGYAVITWIAFGVADFLGFIGAYTFLFNHKLLVDARNNSLDGHPIFGRGAPQTGGTDVEEAVPVDDAVAA